MTYIPTALSRREDQLLQRYAKDRIVVEAGALLGHSTIQLARTAKHVTSIDRHTGYDYWANDTYRLFRRNLEVTHTHNRVRSVVGDVALLADYPADFAFIDLCGTRHGTLKALRAANSPLIGVHDYDRSGCKGVAQAVEDSGYEIVERVDSLVILRKS
jgi:hypothetical protein